MFRENSPVYAGHHDVRHKQMNRPLVACREPKSLFAVRGSQNCEAAVFEERASQFPEGIGILDEQHGLSAAQRFKGHRVLNDLRYLLLDSGQKTLECRSFAQRAIHPQVTSALFDDAVERQETEASAFAYFL